MRSDIHILKEELSNSFAKNLLVKISLGHYVGIDPELKSIHVKPVLIKNQTKLSFTYRYKTRDIVKNYNLEECLDLISKYFNGIEFRVCTLMTTAKDLIFEFKPDGQMTMRTQSPSSTVGPDFLHDVQKNRAFIPTHEYLHLLGITGENGKVLAQAQDKHKQIHHYIEILSSVVQDLSKSELIKVVDMGSGKGYLTFALYDYLVNTLGMMVDFKGIETRKNLVDLSNLNAIKSGFHHLTFIESTIEEYPIDQMDVLIALHACDTATDDAIAKGIEANAQLIVVAPCCHKQIRKEMAASKVKNDVEFLTRHGIFMERQSEMITDGIRALILEYHGYVTKVIDFISEAHTPKNIMILGRKKKTLTVEEKEKIKSEIAAIKSYFGVRRHHLEKVIS